MTFMFYLFLFFLGTLTSRSIFGLQFTVPWWGKVTIKPGILSLGPYWQKIFITNAWSSSSPSPVHATKVFCWSKTHGFFSAHFFIYLNIVYRLLILSHYSLEEPGASIFLCRSGIGFSYDHDGNIVTLIYFDNGSVNRRLLTWRNFTSH